MAARWYNSGLQKILNGSVTGLVAANIDCLLLTSGYSFNDEHDFVADLTPGSNELSGGNYARLTAPTGRAVNLDDANDGATWDADDPTFPSLGAAAGTPAHLVWFVNVGTDATNILLCANTLPGTAPDGNNYVCQLQATGIAYIRNVAGDGMVYNSGIQAIMLNDVDLLTDTVNHTLHTATYSVVAEHDTYADLTNELSGGGYAEQVIDTPAVNLDDTNNGAVLDAVDPVYPSLGVAAGSPTQMVTHSQTDADQLICQNVLTTPDVPDGNNYNIVLAAGTTDGLLRVRNSAS